MENLFKTKITSTKDFVITFELVPGHGLKNRTLPRVMDFAKQAAQDKILDAVTLTDNPSGFPSLSPDALSKEINSMGIQSIVHITCRDSSRFGLFSRIQQLHRMGVQNLLALTGDYPAKYDASISKPCFDLDAVTLLCTLNQMNAGIEPFCTNRGEADKNHTDFFIGAGISCCKSTEAEQMLQYYKLMKKINNGAQFIITQLCYNTRKFHELKQFLSLQNIERPLIGSVFMLSEPAARFLNSGSVPGIFISDDLYRKIKKEASEPDKGYRAKIERSAKLMAILKGLGYRGAHIGGAPMYGDVVKVIKRFHEIKQDWQSFYDEFDYHYSQGFYLYQYDPDTKLNRVRESKKTTQGLAKIVPFLFFEPVHLLFFNQKSFYFLWLKKRAQRLKKNNLLYLLFNVFEHAVKIVLFDCRNCGDCVVFKMAYLCPESQCPKGLRNGPCGGSSVNMCEVNAEKTCVWVRVYERMSVIHKTRLLGYGCLPPRNWALNQTSSWLNFYLEIDNQKINPFTCDAYKKCNCPRV